VANVLVLLLPKVDSVPVLLQVENAQNLRRLWLIGSERVSFASIVPSSSCRCYYPKRSWQWRSPFTVSARIFTSSETTGLTDRTSRRNGWFLHTFQLLRRSVNEFLYFRPAPTPFRSERYYVHETTAPNLRHVLCVYGWFAFS
jgi:hypothetical protein